MSRVRTILLLLALLAAWTLTACATTQEETVPDRKLSPVKAQVTSAVRTGTEGGHPVIELRGTLPGPGWTAELSTTRGSGTVDVHVLGVPGKGAKRIKGGSPYVQKFVVETAGSGTVLRIFNERELQIKRLQ